MTPRPIIAFFLLHLILAVPIREQHIKVPDEFLVRLQSVRNISQFMDRWVSQPTIQRSYLLEDSDNSEIQIARPAGCIPEMQIIEFDRNYDSSVIIWPSCTRVKRCGGCCSSQLLECIPTRTSFVTVKVIKARYSHPGAEMLDWEGYENVRLEQHDRCSCQCRQRASDCGPLQIFQPGQCRCLCTNQHLSTQCITPEQYWDSRECCCRCRRITDCSSGSLFNKHTCRCEHTGTITESVLSPPSSLKAFYRGDGGENEPYPMHYAGNVQPFSLSEPHNSDFTVLADNGTQTQWTEG